MSDIFLSYANEDLARAKAMADALAAQGWTVVWDRDIPPGKTWRQFIGAALDKARCVLVLWSRFSIESDWVHQEAEEGKDRGVLVPAFIDTVKAPLGFRTIQGAHLQEWRGDRDDPEFLRLVEAVNALIGAGPDSSNERQPSPIAQPGARAPGSTFRDRWQDGTQGPEMVVIPAGEFFMGSSNDDESGEDDEKPQHRVTIAQPFALGQYAVTFAEYDVFATATERELPYDQGWGRGRRPVINVVWDDAQAYAAWLSEQTGKRYRLPSEAEWEYAARAGTTTRYWWGDDVGDNHANCDGCGSQWDSRQTAPVGSFEPNAFGLHDMLGNVWEWVEDCWHDRYAGAPVDGAAWGDADGGVCERRVVRGGSWTNFPRYLRSVNRYRSAPGYRSDFIGFRLAQEI